MKKIIVGNSGFVGSNLCTQTSFDGYFNSKNIQNAFNLNPEVCVYAGVRAEKFIANSNPEQDLDTINTAIDNIKKINPKFLILISTIDVYSDKQLKNENHNILIDELEPYGKNRLILEKWVENNFKNYLIVRLPALFGKGLKKNFIYDYMHRIPKLIKAQKFDELCFKNSELENYYFKNEIGFYQLKNLTLDETNRLILILEDIEFSSLNFTDSRNKFQFYNLDYLWDHIQISIQNGIKKINLVSEPISANEIYQYLENTRFVNHILDKPVSYNLKSNYYSIFDGYDGYLFKKEFILNEIKEFIRGKE